MLTFSQFSKLTPIARNKLLRGASPFGIMSGRSHNGRMGLPLRLECLCGASNVDPGHQAYWDGSTFTHPRQDHLEELANERGIAVVVQPGDPLGVYSDAYLYFRPEQIDDVVAILNEADWPGDILDLEGEISPEDRMRVVQIAHQEGWSLDHGWNKDEIWPGGTAPRISNILDPIQEELDPDVFNRSDSIDPDVKPKIVEWVKKKVYSTILEAGWPDPSNYLSMMLTGSLTTYQWSADSDFDISLWIDVERLPEYVRWDLISMMIEHCDGTIVPGTTHPLQCFVVDVTKFKKEDLYQVGTRSAYDLDRGHWYVLPEKERSIDVSKRWPEHIRYAQGVVDKLKILLRYGDADATRIYYKFLHDQRRRDMQKGKGDFAVSNIVYKMIMNEGLAPEITALTGMYIA